MQFARLFENYTQFRFVLSQSVPGELVNAQRKLPDPDPESTQWVVGRDASTVPPQAMGATTTVSTLAEYQLGHEQTSRWDGRARSVEELYLEPGEAEETARGER